MKATITKEVRLCDKCKAESPYPDVCLRCGIELCHDCAKKHGHEYPHSIFCSGSGDGFYCKACDQKLAILGTDKRHNAYAAIQTLRAECESWNASFDKRRKAAEELLKSLS